MACAGPHTHQIPRTVNAFGPSCLDLAVDQREVVHQLHAGGGWQGGLKVASHCLAGYQGNGTLEVQCSVAVFRPTMLVDPAEVVSQQVVEKALAPFEHTAQFRFDGLSVGFVPLDHPS